MRDISICLNRAPLRLVNDVCVCVCVYEGARNICCGLHRANRVTHPSNSMRVSKLVNDMFVFPKQNWEYTRSKNIFFFLWNEKKKYIQDNKIIQFFDNFNFIIR